jgi:hypothetical protein
MDLAAARRGVLATAVMSAPMLARWALQRSEPPPPMVVAENAQRAVGLEPKRHATPVRHAAWLAAHAGFGGAVGIGATLWPSAARRIPFALAYGTAVWAANYGIALPLLRLYPRVTRDSLPRALDNYVSHLVYAAAYQRIR